MNRHSHLSSFDALCTDATHSKPTNMMLLMILYGVNLSIDSY